MALKKEGNWTHHDGLDDAWECWRSTPGDQDHWSALKKIKKASCKQTEICMEFLKTMPVGSVYPLEHTTCVHLCFLQRRISNVLSAVIAELWTPINLVFYTNHYRTGNSGEKTTLCLVSPNQEVPLTFKQRPPEPGRPTDLLQHHNHPPPPHPARAPNAGVTKLLLSPSSPSGGLWPASMTALSSRLPQCFIVGFQYLPLCGSRTDTRD